MAFLIAVSGKGGVGKTTVAALIVSRLIARRRTPVLAVDADPNMCLDAALGVRVEKTIGSGREAVRQAAGSGAVQGIGKQEMLEMKISQCLVEASDFDLIAMGRSEGPGCYCYANSVLRQSLGLMAGQYPYTVLDNEAGLENLSRRIVQKVDALLMVSDPSARGLETVRRLHALTQEMGIEYGSLGLIVNRTRDGQAPSPVEAVRADIGAGHVTALPENSEVAWVAEQGRSVFEISGANPAVRHIDALLDRLLDNQ